MRGHHLPPDAGGFLVSGGHHGLVQPLRAGLGAFQHAGREFLSRDVVSIPDAWNAGDFNTDQGVQFTSQSFTGELEAHGVQVSMDGRVFDNIFIERFWRSLKYEDVYLHDYVTGPTPGEGLAGTWTFIMRNVRIRPWATPPRTRSNLELGRSGLNKK